ncbi:MAG: hypothetical protein DHS20C01_26750 [marine bacterium B5-7]|nr:MAG: hypothetical protein DHS20C01_26750 [marine bacterium B5-7]
MISDQPLKLLFNCSHNTCRNILSEAFTRHIAGDFTDEASAGSNPVGNALKVHWGLPDPSQVVGTNPDIDKAFDHVVGIIQVRIHELLTQPLLKASTNQLARIFKDIGERY